MERQGSVTVEGHVLREFTYRDDMSFGVYLVSTMDMGDVTVIGTLPQLIPGEKISVDCVVKLHRTYGKQYSVTGNLVVDLPRQKDMVRTMLSNSFAYGIADSYAANLADVHGANIFSVFNLAESRLRESFGNPVGDAAGAVDIAAWLNSIYKQHSRSPRLKKILKPLTDVPGIGGKRAVSLIHGWMENRHRHEAMLFLYRFGVSPSMVQKIVAAYSPWVQERISKNPYALVADPGLSFDTVDRMAREFGFDPGCPERIDAGIGHVLRQNERDGNTSIRKAELIQKASELLDSGESDVIGRIFTDPERLTVTRSLGEEYVSSAWIFSSEKSVSARIGSIASGQPVSFSRKIRDAVVRAEKASGFSLDKSQRWGLDMAVNSPVSIITGGAGTGKSTIMRILTDAAETAGLTTALCSPTGKAAKRLQQVTGRPASTIHRLLGWRPGITDIQPIEADVVIVDEASMVDLYLMNALIKGVQRGSRLLLVGDPHQLPSVGPGNVLGDMIGSMSVPFTTLEIIHRQKSGGPGGIIENAALINDRRNGNGFDSLRPGRFSDGEFCCFSEKIKKMGRITRENRPAFNDWIAESIVKAVAEVLPERFGYRPMEDVQVLLPMRVGGLGTNRLNAMLQERLNPLKGRDEILSGGDDGVVWRWRPGDRVVCVRNDYDHMIFNGEQGIVSAVDTERRAVEVEYPDLNQSCLYEYSELRDIEPAYALTIHKSQGSEFPCVVLGVTTSHYPMLERKLLYTGVTRASEKCLLFCEEGAIDTCMRRSGKDRTTLLGLRIKALSGSGLSEEVEDIMEHGYVEEMCK